jgi:hypothetical protein
MGVSGQVLDRLQSKIERAERNIRELDIAWKAFRSKAYLVRFKDELETQERVWYLAHAYPVSNEIKAIVGDAVHNLRCSLDHLCYRLAHVATGGKGPFKNLFFPSGNDTADFLARLDRAQKGKTDTGGIVQRLGPDTIKAISALEPYHGGRGEILWCIHQLDIVDKHRLLLTFAFRNPDHSMSPSGRTTYKRGLGIKNGEFTPDQERALFRTQSSAPFPLNANAELWRLPIAEADYKVDFTFEIAFGEAQILYGNPVIPALYQMGKFIRDIIRDFNSEGLLG